MATKKKRWKPTTKKRGSGKLRDRGAKIPNLRMKRQYDIGVQPLDAGQVVTCSFVVLFGTHEGRKLLDMSTPELNTVLNEARQRRSRFAENVQAELDRRENNRKAIQCNITE